MPYLSVEQKPNLPPGERRNATRPWLEADSSVWLNFFATSPADEVALFVLAECECDKRANPLFVAVSFLRWGLCQRAIATTPQTQH